MKKTTNLAMAIPRFARKAVMTTRRLPSCTIYTDGCRVCQSVARS